MSQLSFHKHKVEQARADVKRMLAEVETALELDEPNYLRLSELFCYMETACRSGSNQACDVGIEHRNQTE